MRALIAAVLSLAVTGLAAQAGDVKVINAEARFPEGPVWHDGKLHYVEYGGHTVMTWDGKTNAKLWQQDGCGPAAVVPTAGGELLVTCYDANTVVRLSASGETLATYSEDKDGQPFVGPNDFAADAKGGVFFTASGPWDSGPIVGKILYLAADGSIASVADDLHYANGIALSRDGKTLYAGESEAFRIIQFTVGENGALSDRRLFARLGALDAEVGWEGYPDGLKVDSQGRLYIAQFSAGEILVVGTDGTLERKITVPSPSAPNLAFAPGEETVYVMAVDDVSNPPYIGKVYEVANR